MRRHDRRAGLWIDNARVTAAAALAGLYAIRLPSTPSR
jgi:hypothetical protein